MNCVFCKMVKGEVSCHKVFENKSILAFMDIHPINRGHVLVIPKRHVPDFYEIEEKLYNEPMARVKQISKAVYKVTKPKKIGLAVAGFDVPHTHVHIIPMHEYHDLTSKSLLEGKIATPTAEELKQIANQIKVKL